MPIARFEMPDGRIARFEVPDGTTPEQARSMIQAEITQLGTREDIPAEPVKIGKEAFPDTLREVLRGTDWGTRNIAGAGTSLSNLWEGIKQFAGQENQGRIQANNIIRDEAPIGAIAGDVALTAGPFALAGKSIPAAAAVGGGYGLTLPVEANNWQDVAKGKALNTGIGAATGAGGQWVANKASGWLANKTAQMAQQQAQNAQRDATLKAGQELGLVVSPAEVNPTLTNRVLTGFAGKLTTQQEASAKNSAAINAAVRKELGIPSNVALSDDVIASYRKMKGKPYQEIAALGDLPVDAAYAGAKKKPMITGATKATSQYVDDFGNAVDVPPMPKPEFQRNLLNEIIKAGGINKAELPDIGIEKVKRPGLFRKDGGMDADRLAEWMQQNGWINEQELMNADRFATGGSNDLARKMVRNAFEGTDDIFHPSEVDAAMDYSRKLYDWGEQFGHLTKKETPGSLGNISGENAIEKLKDLRFNSKAYWQYFNRSGDPKAREAAKAFDSAVDNLESFIERGASTKGRADLVPELRQARKDIAKAHAIGKALNDATGNVNPRALAKEKYLTGNLKTVADFTKAFPKDMQPVEQIGAMPGLSPLDFATGAIAGAAGAASGHPQGLFAAGVPLLRPLVRPLLTSKAYQSLMAQPSYNVPITTRMAGGLLGYAPIGGTVLGLNSFGQ